MEHQTSAELSSEPVEQVRVSTLPVGHAWRVDGLDDEHVVALAGALESTPPIVVNRRDMTVVDGAHRVAAARRRGTLHLDVEWFDGTTLESFEEFVRRNECDGWAASDEDRDQGARRALELEPLWSDRRIAHLTGVSPKRVARMRSTNASGTADKRVGRDGRARPVHPGAMRRRIAEALEADPAASLRKIAGSLGVSPETVRSVRMELQGASPDASSLTDRSSRDLADAFERLARREPAPAQWNHDQAFRSTGDGSSFVEWFDSTSVADREVRLDAVPLSRVYEIADEARRRAGFWTKFAESLENRTRDRR